MRARDFAGRDAVVAVLALIRPPGLPSSGLRHRRRRAGGARRIRARALFVHAAVDEIRTELPSVRRSPRHSLLTRNECLRRGNDARRAHGLGVVEYGAEPFELELRRGPLDRAVVSKADQEPAAPARVVAVLGAVEHAGLAVVSDRLHAAAQCRVFGQGRRRGRWLLDHHRTRLEHLVEVDLAQELVAPWRIWWCSSTADTTRRCHGVPVACPAAFVDHRLKSCAFAPVRLANAGELLVSPIQPRTSRPNSCAAIAHVEMPVDKANKVGCVLAWCLCSARRRDRQRVGTGWWTPISLVSVPSGGGGGGGRRSCGWPPPPLPADAFASARASLVAAAARPAAIARFLASVSGVASGGTSRNRDAAAPPCSSGFRGSGSSGLPSSARGTWCLARSWTHRSARRTRSPSRIAARSSAAACCWSRIQRVLAWSVSILKCRCNSQLRKCCTATPCSRPRARRGRSSSRRRSSASTPLRSCGGGSSWGPAGRAPLRNRACGVGAETKRKGLSGTRARSHQRARWSMLELGLLLRAPHELHVVARRLVH